MDRNEQRSWLLTLADLHAEYGFAVDGGHAREVRQAVVPRIGGMHFHERLGRVCPEAWRETAARHGVPLIAHAPGVEHERIGVAGGGTQRRRVRRDETCLAIRRE